MLTRPVIIALFALVLAPTTAAAATVQKIGNEFVYTGTASTNNLNFGTKVANSGDTSPTGNDANKFVFLDRSIPAGGPCVDYMYNPPTPGFPFPDPGPNDKYGVVCTADGDDTVRINGLGGDDFAAGFSPPLCGAAIIFIDAGPCVGTFPRAHVIDGGDGNDLVAAGSGPGNLIGGDDEDTLIGGSGVDVLDGGAGRDILQGGLGADDLQGGTGMDEAVFAYTNDRVVVSLDDAPNDGSTVPSVEGDNVHSSVENVRGSGGSDILTGSGGSNVLTGGPGDDQLDGGGGIDAFYGQAGADTLFTRDGNSERVDCGDDSDVLNSDNGDEKSGCEVDSSSDQLERDLDGDGVEVPADCNDRDAAIKPGVEDRPDNGIDENCDGADATIRDRDRDGFVAPADCDDANPAAKPGAVEVFGNDIDENCNGKADPLLSISSFVRSGFKSGRKTTGIRLLRGASLQAGTEIHVTCAGRPRACGFATKSATVTKAGEFDLRKQFALRSAKVGGRIEILFLRPDSLPKRQTFTFRKGKLPKSSIQCVRPKTGKFGACP